MKKLFWVFLCLFSLQILASEEFLVKYKNTKKLTSWGTMGMDSVKPVSPAINLYKTKNIPMDLSNVEYIEPIVTYHTLGMESEVKWDMEKIQAPEAWEISEGSEEIVVAVIDTGCDYNHEDLKNNIWSDEEGNHGYDFANGDKDPMDDHGHGTHCSGSIGAERNGLGIVGVSPIVKIMCLKFLSGSGSGTSEGAIKSIQWAVDHGAKILSNSWGGGGFSQALYDIIKYAEDRGVVFVAAAGNSATSNKMYPAGYDLGNIISVAASDEEDKKASFSNYGVPHVDVAAPGVSILSTVPNNKYASYRGTSMACPHVSGAVALLLTVEPDLEIAEVVDRVLWTSDYLPAWDEVVVSSGRLNVFNMLTDERPERPQPPPSAGWKELSVAVETPHPYKIKTTYAYEIEIPEAEYVRVHFEAFSTENKYDVVSVSVGDRTRRYSGDLGEFFTKYFLVAGSQVVKVKLVSDYSTVKEGFKIDLLGWQ